MDENIQLLIEAILSLKDPDKSISQIKADLPKIQDALNNDEKAKIKLIAGLDIEKTKKTIQAQLAAIANQAKAPTIKVGVEVGRSNAVQSAVQELRNIQSQARQIAGETDISKTIFNVEQLNREGRMYVSKVTGALETVKNRFLRQGAKDVQFLEFRNANEQLKSFIATVDYGSGIIKKFNFEKAKIDTGGKKANNGFVQTNSMSVSDKSMASYQKMLNFLNTIDKRIADINSKTLLQTNPLQEGTVFYDNYINKLNEVQSIIDRVKNSNSTLTAEEKRNIGMVVNELKNLAKEQQAAAYPPTKLASTGIEDSVKKYSADLNVLEQRWKTQGILVGDFKVKVEQLKSALSNVGTDKNALDNFRTQLFITRREASSLQTALRETSGYDAQIRKNNILISQLEAYKAANTKAMRSNKLGSNGNTFAQEIDNMIAALRRGADPTEYKKIASNFRIVRNEIKELGLEGQGLFSTFKSGISKFANWLGVSNFVMKLVYSVRQAATELKDLDTILTEISKANNKLSSSQLAEIGNNSFDIASKYGKKASGYLSGVQEMSRAGYENAEALGELSTSAQGAGDMTADVANQLIIATDKAYHFNGSMKELTKTLDGINNITNNNAVNMSELSEGYSIVASVAASLNVGANELAAALGTMSAVTQQSGSEVARAFKAILLNIKQVSDEEEGIDAEGLTKYEKACNALGVSLKEVVNGSLQARDGMEVLEDLSNAYVKLDENDLRRINLLNSVGGKLRSTQLDALLRNFDTYKQMLQQFEDGTGSMAREGQKTAESWQGELNRLSNTWSDLVNNFINSDLAKGFLKVTNSVVGGLKSVTEFLGGLPTIISAIMASLSFKNVGELLNTPPYAPLQLCA